MISKIKKQVFVNNILPILILLIAAVLRFWHLGQNPPGLFLDEASNGYNAYSILKTARDEYGNFLPLVFRSFGEYNPAMSVYTLVPSIAIFGLNDFAIRFPSAFLGTLTVLVSYLLVVKLTNDKKIAAISSLLLAISPWHLQFSRYDHEANFMIFFALSGLTLFLYGLKKYKFLPWSAISLGLSLNSYHGAKVWVPLFLIYIFFCYRKEIFKINFAKLIIPLVILSLSILPYLLNFQKSLLRGESVGIVKSDQKLQTFTSGYLSHFSPNFLFTQGDKIGRHSVPGMGELYIFEAPLIFLGIIALIKRNDQNSRFFLFWLLLAPIPASLASPTPHALRALTFIPLWSIIAAFGLNVILSINSKFKPLLIFLLSMIAAYNISTYLHLYYKHYPREKAADWVDGYKDMVNYVNQIQNNYNTIAISNFFGQPYIYVLLYTKYDPSKYQSQSQNKNAFDKYEFFGGSWEKTKPGKALLVTPPWQSHPPQVLKEIYATSGDLVFTISQTE